MRQSVEILGDVLGGYGRGWSNNLRHPSVTTLLAEETMKLNEALSFRCQKNNSKPF